MKREIILEHEFVEYIPEVLSERKLYISDDLRQLPSISVVADAEEK